MLKGMQQDRKKKDVERNVTRQLFNTIVSVNDDSSAGTIKYLIENIPSMDARRLRVAYQQVAPNIELEQHFECNECDFEQDMEVPLTADFFWPDR